MTKKKIAEQAVFVTALTNVLLAAGAVVEVGSFYGMIMDTKAGRLNLKVSPNGVLDGATVFTCFDDPKAAVELLGTHLLNPYSGKWNHHFYTKNVAQSVETLRWQLSRIAK